MAIKWGSTYVTTVKWGNTVCSQVKWGSTIVFPTGGYDGSSYSYPLQNGFTLFSNWSINQRINKSTLSSERIRSKDSINCSLFSSVSIAWTCYEDGSSLSHDIKIYGRIAGSGLGYGTSHHPSSSGTFTYTDTLDLSSITATGILSIEWGVTNNVNSYVVCTITPTKIIFNA